MRILLVGNYVFEDATSMLIWGRALERELLGLGLDARLIAPRPVFGRLRPASSGVGKWLGYIDRYLLFPYTLRTAAAKADVVHLCDHGSAMYSSMAGGKPVLVTCHDMLAVRGALGEIAEMRASRCGVYLQRWICRGLERATRVACVSQATYDDAKRILRRSARLCVVENGLNYPFQPLTQDEVDQRLEAVRGIEKPFLLHLGTNSARKNREAVLRVFAHVAQEADMQLVFAGQPLNEKLAGLARRLGVQTRIVQAIKPDVKVVEALYNRAAALLFPSLCEGFGWPPIEAQACGCPVVASDIPPLREALGSSALLHPLDDEAGMAKSIGKIAAEPEFRQSLRRRGFDNVRARFHTARMIADYVAIYRELSPQCSLRPAMPAA